MVHAFSLSPFEEEYKSDNTNYKQENKLERPLNF